MLQQCCDLKLGLMQSSGRSLILALQLIPLVRYSESQLTTKKLQGKRTKG